MAITVQRPKRLAITISGAVSLGSYEAGVLYELISAIGKHNRHPDSAGDRIKIDVLTGASAGGMTAAIAAQKLLFDAASFKGPHDNPLFLPWVRDISITRLLALAKDENPALSLFSSDTVEALARRYLTPPPQGSQSSHPAAADTIRLGLAMSNLNGVDFGEKALDGTRFVYTRFRDRLASTFGLDDATPPDWNTIIDAAVACGAFPFAFRVKEVARRLSDFPGYIAMPPGLNGNPMPFAYTDGGLFQNEPLGLAKNLVDQIDRPEDLDTRFYIYVSPWAKASALDPKPFRAADADFVRTASQLVKAVFHQAQFRDWVTTEKINQNIALLNRRSADIARALVDGKLAKSDLAPGIHTLLTLLFPGGTGLDTARDRLRKQFKTLAGHDYHSMLTEKRGPAAADLWIDTILVLETAADLGDRDEMLIYTITAKAGQLAGDLFHSFGGFFDERLRLHDYHLGRQHAQQWLVEHATADNGVKPDIGPIRYTPAAIPKLDLDVASVTMKDLDRDSRVLVKNQVLDRVDRVLRDEVDAWYGWFVRWTAKRIAARKLDGLFEL